MPSVTTATLAAELERLEACIEQIPLDGPRERKTSCDKAVAVIYALNRLGLIQIDRARALHDWVEQLGKG